LLTRINRRLQFFRSDLTITKIRPGHWNVERNGVTYHIEGGRAAGGSSRDWFVDGFGGKAIWTSSLVESLKLIDNA